jgi:hypothetical protein
MELGIVHSLNPTGTSSFLAGKQTPLELHNRVAMI